MKMLLIGHRGVGKSSLLQRLQIYSSLRGNTIPVFDLDREIEKSAGAKIQDIFELIGEKNFRKLEIQTYQQVLKRSEYILALGAGFQIDQIQIDPDVQVVWVKRKSDHSGRIFLDRPRLNKEVTPLTEFQERFEPRNRIYQKYANWIYDLPEGLSSPSDIEKDIFFNQIDNISGIITIDNIKSREIKWGFDYYEVRDDQIDEKNIHNYFSVIPKEKILISFRRNNSPELFIKAAQEGYLSDWAIELGPCHWGTPSIFSLHDRKKDENLKEAILRLENFSSLSVHLKLAVEIHNFTELQIGLEWQQKDSQNRSFLPRTTSVNKVGKWNWVRLWLKDRQKLNFIQSGHGHLDQPTVFEWLSVFSAPKNFAAVLGSTVEFSFSPIEHLHFFKQYQMPFFAIQIQESEWEIAIKLLTKMGLTCAAVTAPLKKIAFEYAEKKSDLCNELKSANTLTWLNQICFAENTDLDGLKELLNSVDLGSPVFIWGGGGTLPVIQKLLPEAIQYSVRTQRPRTESSNSNQLPEAVIWAAAPDAAFPPTDWNPKLVIDLNYREDSKAKEYCQMTGARYISGLYMFKTQAQVQRNIWSKLNAGKKFAPDISLSHFWRKSWSCTWCCY